jgi:hypothetical protein
VSTFNVVSEAHRNALWHLVEVGGDVGLSMLYRLPDVSGVPWFLFGVPVQELYGRGLVCIKCFGHTISITSLGRALAKERA